MITLRIRATSTRAEVRVAMPAQITFSHLRRPSGEDAKGISAHRLNVKFNINVPGVWLKIVLAQIVEQN